MSAAAHAASSRDPGIPCVVCGGPLALRVAHGRKSGKPFLMLVCTKDGRHFRAFINDQAYVRNVLDGVDSGGGEGGG